MLLILNKYVLSYMAKARALIYEHQRAAFVTDLKVNRSYAGALNKIMGNNLPTSKEQSDRICLLTLQRNILI